MQISPTAYVKNQVDRLATASTGPDFNTIFDTVQKNAAKYRENCSRAKANVASTLRDESTALKSLPINKDDYNEIEKKLEKAGIRKDTLKRLREQAEDNSLTWDGLFGILEQTAQFDSMPKAGDLSQDAKNQISSFLQQAGLDPTQTNDILTDLEAGKTEQAWKAISHALKNADPNTELSLTEEELLALGKGLQLDSNTLAKLKGMISGETGKLDEAGIKQLSALLDSSIEAQGNTSEKLLQEIKQQLNPLLAKALENNGKTSAGMHATNEENATQILRADQATEKGLGLMPSVNSKDGAAQAQSTNTVDAQNTQTTATAAAVASASGAQGSDAESLLNSNQNGSGNSWMNFFNNVVVADTSVAGQGGSTAGMANFLNQSVAMKPASTSILEQIQSGIFRSLRGGVNQLSLKLNAAEFGPVNVLVSTKNGEVAASIRTENPEAAKALQENMHVLRASLEAQGLKVEKLDVQSGTQNHLNDQGWNDAEQHNAQQEAHQRLLAKQQLRQLKDTKQDLINGAILQQNAVATQQGLYLVA